jgi:hypothetical protein
MLLAEMILIEIEYNVQYTPIKVKLILRRRQVIIYLKSSNYALKLRLASDGAADQIMMAAVLRNDMRLRLELQRGKVGDVANKMFDKLQVCEADYIYSLNID